LRCNVDRKQFEWSENELIKPIAIVIDPCDNYIIN